MKRTRRQRFLIGVRKAKRLYLLRKRLFGDLWAPMGKLEKRDAILLGQYRKTRKLCSCFLCGNPRKYYKEKTLQERRREAGERADAKAAA